MKEVLLKALVDKNSRSTAELTKVAVSETTSMPWSDVAVP
ncbi:MAG: hypothetical protein UU65_C0002G0049 [candidate division CPR2 bacterium GW2011_GWC1_41_48]|uniref:Uncharacterized protein n=1 Tax=candidate division CPR2 bacterium GW2011_GWC1_41_48 TaxID=1618344 RepID=A0A0G0YIA8_UNCC2|nr:MAG: hypothetical protein UT47_C0002G0255 [candidate division CPR2 bacterium GW2011_GWC2_39_35]KKR27771.1 MAG: hypothetical protein UT60_C0037G0008 [candidate division CPR2 bacterium GW2011_GWD2_39_7]KKR28049.1 MAG: hypothetical protein UT59_C0036G0002 [candidate division CPR2 bacterium GW2011_GWD1_39_7]KKS09271.1 MAG: hypothetical protein UU65_C0002G0049 [candidate division CPR2 bacterium GW2011_GWC1_41_48]